MSQVLKKVQNKAHGEICDAFQAFYQANYEKVVLKLELRAMFFPSSESDAAFTFHKDGGILKCTYDKSKVVEVEIRDSLGMAKEVVKAFDEWLASDSLKPIDIEIANPLKGGESMDVGGGVEQPKVAATADVQALLLENAALRQKMEAMQTVQPAAASNEELHKALKLVETLQGQFQTLRLTQEQQGAQIMGTAAQSADAMNMAAKALTDTEAAKSDAAHNTTKLANLTADKIDKIESFTTRNFERLETTLKSIAPEPLRRQFVRPDGPSRPEEGGSSTNKKRTRCEEEEIDETLSVERSHTKKKTSHLGLAMFHATCAGLKLFGLRK